MQPRTIISLILLSLALMACGQRRSGASGNVADYAESRYVPASSSSSEISAKGQDATSAEALEIPAPLTKVSEQILTRTAYTTSYNKDTRLPNWVAWHLTSARTSGPYSREGKKFEIDTEARGTRADNSDYYNSGYDRGHLCPAADNKWSERAMTESFLYTNACPQVHSLNAGDWQEMENKCRDWALAYGDIYIVCGPILYNTTHKTIGSHKVVVPEAFFKVVLCTNGEPKAIGFIYKNADGNRPMGDYVNTVDEVERITGIDFFPSLPDDIENKIEATCSLAQW